MSTEERAKALEALRSAGHVTVCAHVNPDGDAIGSILGITLALRAAGIDARPILAEDVSPPPAYDFLPAYDELALADRDVRPDVLLALDTTDAPRLGLNAGLLERARTVIVIDHHPDNACFGDVNVVDASAPSVGSMIWDLLPDLAVAPDPDVATCLYTALMTDTGRFQYSNTDARALRTAAEMIDAGADPARIATAVYQRRSAAALALTGLVLSRVRLVNDGQVAYSWFDAADLRDTHATFGETEDLVDHVRSTRGPAVAFLVKSDQDGSRISLRAKDSFDVGGVARELGGGGHRAAAGLTLEGGLEDVLGILLPRLPGGAP